MAAGDAVEGAAHSATMKVGKFPIYVWAGIGLGGWYIGSKVMGGSKARTRSVDTSAVTTDGYTVPAGYVGSVPLPTSANIGSGPRRFSSNREWTTAAVAALVGSNEGSPFAITQALESWLRGKDITPTERDIVSKAIARMGAPPDGAAPVNVVAPPSPAPITVTAPPTLPPPPPPATPAIVSSPPPVDTGGAPYDPVQHIGKPFGNRGTYTTHPGDTLEAISSRTYGDPAYWQSIYTPNAATIGPDRNALLPGQVLWLPFDPTRY